MALGTPVAGSAAYSTSGGTTVAPAYPTGIVATDAVLLFVGQKPSTANGGTVTTPSGWTQRAQRAGAGGYGTTLGADTGNTNLRVYSWDVPVEGQGGTLSVTLAVNNVSWAFIVRVPTGGGVLSYNSATGQQASTPSGTMSIALSVGTTDFETGDMAIWAMCIPTDVTTPSQFSSQAVTATGATFDAAVEINEPDSSVGNDIGGYSAYSSVSSGSASTSRPTVEVDLAGGLTNVRGPVVLLRVREAPVTHATTGELTGQGAAIVGAASRVAGVVTHAATGTLSGPGATLSGASTRTRAHDTSGVLTGPGATLAGSAARSNGAVSHDTSGALAGQASSVAGSAARTREHPSTGTLTGSGTALSGSAERTRAHAASGTLAGPGSIVSGSAARLRAFASSGALAGQGAAIAGASARAGAPPDHATTGALVGPGSSVAGSAARAAGAVNHAASGDLQGQGATLVGAAALESSARRFPGFEVDIEPATWWTRKPRAEPVEQARAKVRAVAKVVSQAAQEHVDERASRAWRKDDVRERLAPLVQDMPGFDWVAMYDRAYATLLALEIRRRMDDAEQLARQEIKRIQAAARDEDDIVALLLAI